ncbi:hypothetical protein [Amycolatopsis speibonae]|uniref:Uncharacterized protein n=1 Tax=Amycolatopsis speibonae TaxID=1450224 RepID=A0ABV7P7H8_9PSEU
MTDNILKQLRAPFTADQVGKLPRVTCGDCSAKDRQCGKHQKKTCRTCKAYVSTQHMHIDYVGHAHVTERLLDVDPNWSWEPLALSGQGLPQLDDGGGLWIRLTVGDHTRLGYGHAGQKRGGDAIKEVIGDAIRNAAMRFGVALDLWKKESPEPVVDRQPQQPKDELSLTPAQRAGHLRGLIAQLGKKEDKDINDIASEFREWSNGTEINAALPELLEKYLAYIQQDRS